MSLLEYLPAIYQDTEDSGASEDAVFLRRFLMPFESVMLADGLERQAGVRRESQPEAFAALEDEVAALHVFFDPAETPEAFLAWLAGWVALAWRSDLDPSRQRRILANTVPLYRIRGTRRGIEEVLKLYLDAMPSVTDEDLPQLQIAVHSTVGGDTYLGGGPSFLFQVTLAFPRQDPEFVERQNRLAREVVDLERPAHTSYSLRILYPRFCIGVNSTVGVDTVLAP
jgi:phage tail-like protein